MSDSFDTLAARTLPPLLDEIVSELCALTADAAPHEVKALRKHVGKLRDHLDLFAPVYPETPRRGDRWRTLREHVSAGYHLLGRFKDLYDVQALDRPEDAIYDAAELVARRADVLAWRDAFVAPAHAGAARRFLRRRLHGRALRPRRGLSSRFWGGHGVRPRPEDPALANLARLARRRLRDARDRLGRAERLRDLHEPETGHAMHDARKRVRALAKLFDWFPGLLAAPADAAAPAALLAELARRQGAILDRVNAQHDAAARGDQERADALAAEIAAAWKKVRRWQRRHDVDGALRTLRRQVRRETNAEPGEHG